MTYEDHEKIVAWFRHYTESFITDDENSAFMIQVKIVHCNHVALNCRALAEELSWSSDDILIAETLGLLHDIGRFSQFAEYHTFTDGESVDHGARGFWVVTQSSTLSSLPHADERRILDGIRYHNKKKLPPSISEKNLVFVKLVRDADKLDIFRVINEFIKNGDLKERLKTAINVSIDGPINQRALDEIRKNKTVSYKHVKSQADFHLMQLSWVYDFNYIPTCKRILKMNAIEKIASLLPDDPELQAVSQSLISYLKNKVSTEHNPT
jgi:HD superfamily phosphohydrolase YqeK